MVKLIGKIRRFKFRRGYLCKQCNNLTTWRDGQYVCSNCGPLSWRERQRVYYTILTLNDVYDRRILCIGNEKPLDQMLRCVGFSLRMINDSLKGLRGTVWFERWKEIRRDVEKRIEERYIMGDRAIAFKGSLHEDKDKFLYFIIKSVAPISQRTPFEKRRFVEAKYRSVLEVTNNVLSDYDEHIDMWGDIPVLHYTKKLDDEEIEIGIRVPVAEYGKAYTMWMRVNDVHMYPADHILVAGPFRIRAWVYRVYHTKRWKENLTEKMKYCVSLEEHAVRVVKAAREISMQDLRQLVNNCPELSMSEAEEVINEWTDGSLWDLAKEMSKINKAAGLWVLKEFGFLKER